MRISDWSSDVCSSDLLLSLVFVRRPWQGTSLQRAQHDRLACAGRMASNVVDLSRARDTGARCAAVRRRHRGVPAGSRQARNDVGAPALTGAVTASICHGKGSAPFRLRWVLVGVPPAAAGRMVEHHDTCTLAYAQSEYA